MLSKLQVGPARSVDVSPDGEMVAVGLKNGGFVVISTTGFRVWGSKRERGSMILCMRLVSQLMFDIFLINNNACIAYSK